MNRRFKLLSLAALVALMTVALVAAAKLESIGNPDVQFRAVGPAGLKIDGRSSLLSASEKDGKLTVVAPLTNLKTGISLRDRHLRHYLGTEKYPNATLTVERSKLKMPADKQTVQSSAVGRFSMHGVTKPVTVRYRAKRTGSDYHVQGLTEVDIRDFGIEVPCYLGVCVHPDVKIKVKFKLREMQ
jgi:polyisoprenoid-binding protein YceI